MLFSNSRILVFNSMCSMTMMSLKNRTLATHRSSRKSEHVWRLGVVNTASENHQDYPDRPGRKTIGHAEVAARKMVADPFASATPS